MARIYEVTRLYRERLLRREARVVREMLSDWSKVEADLLRRAAQVGDLLEQTALAGGVIEPVWLFQQQRVEELLRQAQLEMARLSEDYSGILALEARGAAVDGARAAAAQLSVSTAFATRLSTSAVESIAAATKLGPLADLLSSVDLDGNLRNALITGIARGANPRAVAREVAGAINASKARTLTIARTEMARAQRQATYDSYRAAGVGTWQWLSAQDATTCAACWGMDGQQFPVEMEVDDHPNGRCAIVPVTEGISLAEMPNKEQAWGRLSEAEQRKILGPTRYDQIASEDVALSDLVATRYSDEWGMSIGVAPLSQQSAAIIQPPVGAVSSPTGAATTFASRQEAEDYIRNTFVRDTGYDGRPLQRGFTAPIGASKVRISAKADLDYVATITDEVKTVLDELAETMPNTFADFRFAGFEIRGSSQRELAHVFCFADGRNPQWIAFKGDSAGTVDYFVKAIENSISAARAGNSPWAWYYDSMLAPDIAGARESIRRLVRHEMGHAVQNSLGRGSEAAREWMFAVGDARRSGFRIDSFSTYGKKDSQEFFAECFSYYWTDPANTRGMLPPELLKWFRTYLPRRGM